MRAGRDKDQISNPAICWPAPPLDLQQLCSSGVFPPSSLSPCSLLCPSFSAAAQHHLSRTPWSQRFLLLRSLPGGLRVQVAQVARRPSMHQGWRRRKKRKWWLVWRNGEKAMMKRSPRLVLGSDVDAGDLKEQIKRRLHKDCYALMTGIVQIWAKTINCSYERQNKKCLFFTFF